MFRHRVANLLHEGGEVSVVERGGGDGCVEVHEDGAGAEDEGVAGQDLSCADDCDGDDRKAGLECYTEAALLEWLERAVARARAFGKEEDGEAGAYLACGASERGDGLGRRAAVDRDVTAAAHVPAEEGNLEDLALGGDA